jgi:uncharacterized protein (TIGR02246 family)
MYSEPARRTIFPPGLLLVAGAIAAGGSCGWLREARAQGGSEPRQHVQGAAAEARGEERAAVKSALDSFVKAFVARDAKALAGHFTDEGEYVSVEGTRVKGKDSIEKGFTAFFAKTPEVAAEGHSDATRFLSVDSAIDEGSVTVRRGPLAPAVTAHYTALFVRENGRWRLAQLSESDAHEASIEGLGWLVGEWKSTKKEGAEILTTYSWHPNKKFLQGQFTIKEKDRTFSGTQIIGVDPRNNEVHSWTFEADGGFGEADWHRDGDHWVLEATGTMSDGTVLKETNILRRVNDDKFTWQSVNRTLEDSELADLAPVKVTRVKTEK